MRGVTWLHLSDWHQRGAELDRQIVRDALIRDLERRQEIDERLAELDFIIFSGDLAFNGLECEYEVAGAELLDAVLEVTRVPKDRLILVPGNHDLDRSKLRLVASLQQAMRDEETVNRDLRDPSAREILVSPMRAYSKFVRKYLGAAAPEDPCYRFLRTFSFAGARISIVGMNSAWMCGQNLSPNAASGKIEVRDQGFLLLGEPQFLDLPHSSEFRNADWTIGVLHHPVDWFNKDLSRRPLGPALESQFDLLLRGHEHSSLACESRSSFGRCTTISGGAAYDRRDSPNGFNFVRLDFERREGTVFFRRYDQGRGFHKDTVTTGDRQPGIYCFALPPPRSSPERNGDAAPPAARRLASPLEVFRVGDPNDEAIVKALDLYAERIPSAERFEAPDIMRWLRSDHDAAQGGRPFRDFFIIAKQESEVCGFALLHSHPLRSLAFVAYLVADKGITVDRGTVSSRLLAVVGQLFSPGGELADCPGILLEVDDPRTAPDEVARRERIARIRLFCTLAERERFALRALDFDYRQPLLEIPADENRGQELPMLLMYAQRKGEGFDAVLSRERAAALLAFIYTWLYPEGFSDVPEENAAYQAYTAAFYAEQVARLPNTVATLTLGKIIGRSEAARCGPDSRMDEATKA